jgi:hypothetical protein
LSIDFDLVYQPGCDQQRPALEEEAVMAYHQLGPDQHATYEIQALGYLDSTWSDWFADLAIQVRQDDNWGPVTTLVGQVADQAALYGLLQGLYTLRLPLLLVRRLPSET